MRMKYFINRDMSVLFEHMIQTGIRKYTEQAVGSGFNFRYRKIDNSLIYHEENELKEIGRIVSERAGKDLGYLMDICDGCRAACENLVETGRNIGKRHENAGGNATAEQLSGMLRQYFGVHRKAMPYLPLFPAVIDSLAEKLFDEEMERAGITGNGRNEVDASLVSWGYADDERASLKRLAGEVRKNKAAETLFGNCDKEAIKELGKAAPDLYEAIGKHAREYGWISIHHLKGKPLGMEDVMKRVGDELKSDGRDKGFCREMIGMEFLEMMERFGFDYHAGKRLEVIRSLRHWRNSRKSYMDKSAGYMMGIFRDAEERLGIGEYDSTYLTTGEIADGMEGKLSQRDLESRIDERKKGYAMIMADGVIGVFGNAVEQRPCREYGELTTGEVRGMGQMKRVVEGHVRVIRRKEDIDGIEKGEIIITPTLSGDYPLSRVRAVVAEEGGMTAHIITQCRTHEIPVILRAAFATRMFETGDYVRFDEGKGIVRRIGWEEKTSPGKN